MTGVLHFHKQEHGQSANVYRLIGRSEDALTYALGHLMAVDGSFFIDVLKEFGVLPRVRGQRYALYRTNYEIYLQEQRNIGTRGRRDIVVDAGGDEGLRAIVEAKIGRGQPSVCQLLRYSVGCRCGQHPPDPGLEWGSRSAKYLAVLTRDPIDSSVKGEVCRRLEGSGIRFAAAQWLQIFDVVLNRQRQLDRGSSNSIFLSEFADFFRRHYDMDVYDAEVMVQDEDSLNAPIYLDHYMYVGGRRWSKMPLYFAPYFTNSCVNRVELPQITRAGVSYVSKVEEVRQMRLDDLTTNPVQALPAEVKGRPNWRRWRHGLSKIQRRAVQEEWWEDSVWLYFLSEPVPLGRTIKKPKGLSRLAPGSRTTFFDLLKHDELRIGSQ